MASVQAAVLAAGKGTRMQSALPKVLHQIGDETVIGHVLNNLAKAGFPEPIIIVGPDNGQIRQALGDRHYVVQPETKGTGEATMQACSSEHARDFDHLLVMCGDMPLISPTTLRGVVKAHLESDAAISLTTLVSDDPHFAAYSKVQRAPDGRIVAVAKGLAGNEVDAGPYCTKVPWYIRIFPEIPPDGKGEIPLPSAIEIALAQGLEVTTYTMPNEDEAHSVNTPEQLAEVARILGA